MTRARFRDRYGPWALVVGGSEGLGAAFADRLAAHGLDLVLVARRGDVLGRVAQELRRGRGVQVRTVALDAAAVGGPAAILRRVRGLEIGLLVCSAARSPVAPFLELPATELDAMLDLNCRTAVHLVHALARPMVARGRGGVVLMGSMAGLQGAALVAHYAATKAYLRVLAEGLWEELRPAGVDVVACCAGRVRTPTWERGGPRAAVLAPPVMEAGPVVEETLAALGRQPVVIPGRLNRLAALATSRLLPPRTAVALVSAATRRMYPSVRAGWRRPARPDAPGRSGRSRRG